jgi:hypothetical protein
VGNLVCLAVVDLNRHLEADNLVGLSVRRGVKGHYRLDVVKPNGKQQLRARRAVLQWPHGDGERVFGGSLRCWITFYSDISDR